jgi:outer membrane protein insertion porin family
MKRTRAAVLGAWLFLALPAGRAEAQPAEEAAPPIERIEILNNQYLQKETLLFYVSTKPGDPYDERKLREDFKRLWDTGFLDDLQVEVVDGQQGKVVRFKVTERKRIQIVDYRGSKDLTTSSIEDALKEKDAQVKIDTFYDPAKARKVEAIIKEMLAQKGRPFATVKHEAKNIGGSGQQLSFIIDDGPKAKIHEIVFDGNEVYDDAKLRGKMKKLKTPGFFNLSWLGGKTTYTEDKWLGGEEDARGDRGRLEDFYLDHGYVTARVGQPKISYTDGKAGWFKKRPVKLMKLEIPVTEGEQYRMGDLKFEGLTVLKEDFVRGYFKMVPGSVYNDSKFKKAYEKLRDVYGSLGYFQWTGGTQRKPDPEKKVVDITVKMEEDKQYFLGRINFTGNDSTRDKVIRREIYMNEGEVFNTEALKMSIKRVNQLGYFKQMEGAPDIRPSATADNKVDVTFKVEEQNRNQFTFGGGVSGYEGAFLNASFSTANFLGAGETVSLAVQTGSRTKN